MRSPKLSSRAAAALLVVLTLAGAAGAHAAPRGGAALVSIAVVPSNPTVAVSQRVQFTAIGQFSDASTADLTAQATWSSSFPTSAVVSNAAGSAGRATGLASGVSNIRATFGGINGSTALTVTGGSLVAIDVTPDTPTVAEGGTVQLTAVGTFSNGATADLTEESTWSSTIETTATVSNDGGSQGLATGVAAGTSTISATLNAVTGSTTLTVTPTLLSIAVTPSNPTAAAGHTVQFTATGTFSDASTADLTEQATWSSSVLSVATVSNADGSRGLATALSPGTSTIQAALDGVTGSTVLTVTSATLVAIDVTPTTPSVDAGLTRQFIATGTYSNNATADVTTQVTWSSSDEPTATISNAAGSQGLATGVAPGTTTITATLGAVTGSTVLTVTGEELVSISLQPTTYAISIGEVRFFTAVGTYSNGAARNLTQTATWSSSQPAVATVSDTAPVKGRATGVAPGTTQITASIGTISGSASLTVLTTLCPSAPLPACKVPGTTRVLIRKSPDNRRDQMDFTWSRGDATTPGELGDPTIDTQYSVCVWDFVAGAPTLVMEMGVPAAATFHGRELWKSTHGGAGFRYENRLALPDGIRRLTLKAGPVGTPRISVRAHGNPMPDPPMPFQQIPRISVQVVNGLGTCWGADFVSPPKTNTAQKLSARERP